MKHWNHFWQTTRLLSNFTDGESKTGIAGEAQAFWESVLAELPKKATIVDIGSGNGGLSVFIRDYATAHKKDWTIHAVDLAEIAPETIEEVDAELAKKVATIEFHAQTNMNALPFADGSVDLVASQFGFEYGDTSSTLPEIKRVLKDKGRFVAMSHHKSSTIYKASKDGAELYDYTVNHTPVFLQTDMFLRIAEDVLKKDSVEKLQNSLLSRGPLQTVEWLLRHVGERYSDAHNRVWMNDIHGRINSVVQQAKDAEGARQAQEDLAVHYLGMQVHGQRLGDLANASWDAKAVKKVEKEAKKAKLDVAIEPFEREGELHAWTVKMEKAAG
ncbi:MAG: class I SAM-dependent methyltransferase [Idiomarina sp.]|nr:class I SAM-dependent methyltransferase [Idiomarina sp.]